MITFKEFLAEGGNVKIGDVAANPIKITKNNRSQVTGDVEEMLYHLHNSFNDKHNAHLFGDHKQALRNGSAYSGSTRHLMNHEISHSDFASNKPTVGDIDVAVPKEHMVNLHAHLSKGSQFGKYKVEGVKKGGTELHALMRHSNGEVHQVDFEATDYKDHEPTKFSQFAHSSDWNDSKMGVKGVHHKLLLNAVGLDKYKFATTYGLKDRNDDESPWITDHKKITKELFGQKADPSAIHSFHGIANLVKHHVDSKKHQQIYDKFKNDVTLKSKTVNSDAALAHLKKLWGVHDE